MSLQGRAAVGRDPTAARRLRHAAWTRIGQSPRLYLLLEQRRHPQAIHHVLTPDTELVIDGFSRSASSFAVYAFQLAQPRPVRLAHHSHTPALLMAADRRHIPALALVREPEETVLSIVIRQPERSLEEALQDYTSFYRSLLPYRAQLAVATFREVIHDFGGVIRKLNQTFRTSFAEFEHNEANVRECFELIEWRTRRPQWGLLLRAFTCGLISREEFREEFGRYRGDSRGLDGGMERRAARPSKERARLKQALRAELGGSALAESRAWADEVYNLFVSPPPS